MTSTIRFYSPLVSSACPPTHQSELCNSAIGIMSCRSKVAKLSIECFRHVTPSTSTPAPSLQRLWEYTLALDSHTSLHTEYIPLSQPTFEQEIHPTINTTTANPQDFLINDCWNEVSIDIGRESECELPHEKQK